MDQNTPLSITDRKKSLEENSSVPAVKSVKVEHASSFSIKPLIDFFNRAFRREISIQEPPLKESTTREECTEQYPECDLSKIMIVDLWSSHSWQPVQRMDILLACPWQKSLFFWDPWFPMFRQ